MLCRMRKVASLKIGIVPRPRDRLRIDSDMRPPRVLQVPTGRQPKRKRKIVLSLPRRGNRTQPGVLTPGLGIIQ
jgi:hypothetical protein